MPASPRRRVAAGDRRRWCVGTVALGLASLAVVTTTAACSVQGHYALWSFFFDGVPDPAAPPTDLPVYGPRPRSGPMSLEERAAIQQQRMPASTHSFHPPFRDKQCGACHSIQRQGDWIQGTPELRAPIDQLCARCHQPPQQPFVHGPVATVSCQICHEHHSSAFPHLLKTAPAVELCARCHQGATFTTREQHQQYGDRSCVECHDPHASTRQFLLREPGAPTTAIPTRPQGSPVTPVEGKVR